MSAKKRERNWVKCDKCLRFFSRSDHLCGDENEEEIQSGFIENNTLHAVICKYNDSYGKLPNENFDYILINPTTLKTCNISIASTVEVSSCDSYKTYCTVWSLNSVKLDHVVLFTAKIKSLHSLEGEVVKISRLEFVPPLLDVAVLKIPNELIKDELKTNELKLMLSSLLDSICLIEGDYVSVTSHNVETFLELDKVNDSYDCDIRDKFENLTLDGQHFKHPKVFRINHSKIEFIVPMTPTIDISLQAINDKRLSGLRIQYEMLDEIIIHPFSNPQIYSDCGLDVPKGIILFGPSGVGKTIFVNNFLATLPNVTVTKINGPELTSKYFGETEQKLRDIFKKTMLKSPSIVVIDEFDTLCPKRSTSSNESEKRIVATFCTLLDSIPPDSQFVVLVITNSIDSIDSAVRRPGRLEKEIEFCVPNTTERYEILSALLQKVKTTITDINVSEIASVTHGYVGADLSALVKESGMLAVKEAVASGEEKALISLKHCLEAMFLVGPSALKAMTVDIPKVKWTDVGGQNEVKQKLKEAIEWPLKHPAAFTRLGIKPPRGLLMYGPPGCSKTMMAKALATESSLNFISIKGPELFNKYLGESERAIREVFRKARLSAPSIVFFDEIDAISVQRSGKDKSGNTSDRVLTQLLTELDGVESLDGVVVVAATNRPDIIDPALLRPGRIDRLIYVALPDKDSRLEIFKIQLQKMPVKDISLETLVNKTESYSGAEICSICQEAGLFSLRENIDAEFVNSEHFESAIKHVRPGTTDEMLQYYHNFSKTHSK